jgi:hypothetical protein
MAETAVLDNVLGVHTNVTHSSPMPSAFNFSDPLSNPSTMPEVVSRQTMPTLPTQSVGMPPARLSNTISEPIPDLGSESMAQFLKDISDTLADVS